MKEDINTTASIFFYKTYR